MQILHLMEYLYRHPMAMARVVLRNRAVGNWSVSPALLITTLATFAFPMELIVNTTILCSH